MATVVITPEMQRANAEALLGKDPGKFRDPGQRWTAKRYAEIQRLLKQAEADKPVTILNLNPFPLKINGGVFFPEEIAACPPGKPYTVHVIRETRWGHKDLGCDAQNMMQMEPVPAIPLVLAAEYIREYVQQDGGFGGVLCYVGDHDPATHQERRAPFVFLKSPIATGASFTWRCASATSTKLSPPSARSATPPYCNGCNRPMPGTRTIPNA